MSYYNNSNAVSQSNSFIQLNNGVSMNNVSDSCLSNSQNFLDCAASNSNGPPQTAQDYESLCDSCSGPYTAFAANCTDTDYHNNFQMVNLFLVCHKEDNKYCTPSLVQQYSCDNCGKFIAKTYADTNNTASVSSANLTSVQQCQQSVKSSTSSLASSLFTITGLSILFLH